MSDCLVYSLSYWYVESEGSSLEMYMIPSEAIVLVFVYDIDVGVET